jgi:hypothetical protein
VLCSSYSSTAVLPVVQSKSVASNAEDSRAEPSLSISQAIERCIDSAFFFTRLCPVVGLRGTKAQYSKCGRSSARIRAVALRQRARRVSGVFRRPLHQAGAAHAGVRKRPRSCPCLGGRKKFLERGVDYAADACRAELSSAPPPLVTSRTTTTSRYIQSSRRHSRRGCVSELRPTLLQEGLLWCRRHRLAILGEDDWSRVKQFQTTKVL